MSYKAKFNQKDLLMAIFLIGVLLWTGESFFEFLWFNPYGKSFFSLLIPLSDPHELFMRIMFTSVLFLSGIFVFKMYAKLAVSEEQARQSEKNLRIIFDSIDDGVIATDASGYIKRMNPVAERMTGWGLVDAEGILLDDVVRILNIKTRAIHKSPIDKVLRNGDPHQSSDDAILISRTGDEYQISEFVAPLKEDGGDISGVVLVFKDVTERNKQDVELRWLRNYLSNIIDSMPSVLVGVDGNGDVTLWNRTAAQVTGISAKVAKGKSLFKVFPRMENEMNVIFESIRSKEIKREQKKVHQSAAGFCYEDITIFPLLSNGFDGAVVRIDDVTELIKMELSMIQNEKMMSVGGLAAGMAHEINNPLGAILGHTQNINNRVFGDLEKNISVALECDVSLSKVREYLERRGVPRMLDAIYSSSNQAAKIVSNMVNFSRKTDCNFGKHSLAVLMESTLELAANDYDLKKHYDFCKIEVLREYQPGVSCVYCDSSEIQQVFLNLLKNGAQSMLSKEYRGGHPKFIFKLYEEDDMVVFEVEDNGPGINEDEIKRIFEPFYSTKKVGQGVGLGLSISYFVITDQHKGSMEVHSLPGSWARFTIKLPVALE